jgi:hypothetical protein
MADTDPSPTPPRSRSRSTVAGWLWAAGTVLLVAGTGVATWRITGGASYLSPAESQSSAASAPAARLAVGHDYYLHVKLIELTDRRPDGKAWDYGDSGPDIRFSLTWHKNVIWKSSEKSDTLIGSWDLLKVDLKQIVTSGGQTDLEGLVNAPLVHYERGEQVVLKVWDEDAFGSDDAGTLTLKLEELMPGDNTLLPELGKKMAIKRVVLALIDRRTPLPDLVDMISKR